MVLINLMQGTLDAERRRKATARQARYRARHPERDQERKRRFSRDNPEADILRSLRYSAKKRGLDFDLVVKDIEIPEFCPMLGIPLKRLGKREDGTVSVDRIDATKGYVRGNIQVISLKANRIKNNSTIEEMEAVLAYRKRTEKP